MEIKYYKVIYETGDVKIIVSKPGWCKVHLKSQGSWKTDTFPSAYPIYGDNDYSEISEEVYNEIIKEMHIPA